MNTKKAQHECLIGPLCFFLFECPSLSGLPGAAGDDVKVCAEFCHLGLPSGFSGGGAEDL